MQKILGCIKFCPPPSPSPPKPSAKFYFPIGAFACINVLNFKHNWCLFIAFFWLEFLPHQVDIFCITQEGGIQNIKVVGKLFFSIFLKIFTEYIVIFSLIKLSCIANLQIFVYKLTFILIYIKIKKSRVFFKNSNIKYSYKNKVNNWS